MNDNLTATDGSAGAGSRKAIRERVRVRSDVELLTEISSKLDRVVAVLAAQGKDREAQIDILSGAGCDSAFIGSVVGLTAGAVRTYQSRKRGRGTPDKVANVTSPD